MAKSVYSDPIKLNQPIERGSGDKKQVIEEVKLRKPNTGSLRGLKLSDILQMDVSTMGVLLPRISEPALDENDFIQMDPSDFTNMCVETLVFFNKEAPTQ